MEKSTSLMTRIRIFLGSTFFAEQYVRTEPGFTYRWGILLDMVGDANLQLRQENPQSAAGHDPWSISIWRTARRLGVREFSTKAGYEN